MSEVIAVTGMISPLGLAARRTDPAGDLDPKKPGDGWGSTAMQQEAIGGIHHIYGLGFWAKGRYSQAIWPDMVLDFPLNEIHWWLIFWGMITLH